MHPHLHGQYPNVSDSQISVIEIKDKSINFRKTHQ